MTCRIVAFVFAVVVVSALLVQPVSAAVETTMYFDMATQSVIYELTGGTGDTYTVHFTPSGCVGGPADSAMHSGPGFSGSFPVTCGTPNGEGSIYVGMCLGTACFAEVDIPVICTADCHVYNAEMVPALTTWGTVILLLLMLSTAVWIFRKKRVHVS